MTEPRDLEPVFQDFINALVARIATDVCARLAVAQDMRPRLLTASQAAIYLGRTEKAVYALKSRAAFPVVQADGRVMFDVQDLDRWIEQNKMGAA
jgi:predicted DNA-binding transcriptional regulator AlpA